MEGEQDRQSVIGIVSFVSSGLGAIMIVGLFPLMSYLERNDVEIPESWQFFGALFMPVALLLMLVGIVAGIAGLFVKDRRKKAAIVGLIVGCASIVLFVGILVFVFAFAAKNGG